MTNNITKEQLQSATEQARADFCPFGYMDIERAVNVALEVNEYPSWVYETVEQFSEDCATPIKDCDPVSIVYDSILQSARTEIEQLTNYDLCNDCKSGEIYVAGNFCCTSFDYKEEAIAELKAKLKKAKVSIEDLDIKTQWFLSELNIDLKAKKAA